MFYSRDNRAPVVHPTARVAPTAQIVGNVVIGPECFVDHQVVIASSGPPVVLEGRVAVFANAVIRSVGGAHRPAFPVHVGSDSVIGPLAALAGCRVGRRCYVATGAMIFQGAVIGDGARLGAGCIVHLRTVLPERTRVGLRHFAVPTEDGALVTADVARARRHLAAADFFGTVFEADQADPMVLHREVMDTLLREVLAWSDQPAAASADDAAVSGGATPPHG